MRVSADPTDADSIRVALSDQRERVRQNEFDYFD